MRIPAFIVLGVLTAACGANPLAPPKSLLRAQEDLAPGATTTRVVTVTGPGWAVFQLLWNPGEATLTLRVTEDTCADLASGCRVFGTLSGQNSTLRLEGRTDQRYKAWITNTGAIAATCVLDVTLERR